MVGIVSRLFPRSAERMRLAQIAATLIPFIQWLHAGAILKSGRDREMSGKLGRGERPADLWDTVIDAPRHAQLFELNLILQACLEKGVQVPDRLYGIVAHVMARTHDLYPTEARDLAFWGMQWCGAVQADLDSAGDGRAGSTEADRAVFRASREAAIRFSGVSGAAASRPTEQEIAYYASLCVPAQAGA